MEKFFGHPITDIAAATGMSYKTIWAHAKGTRQVSAEAAVLYEEHAGIPRYALRPDLWPPELWRRAVQAGRAPSPEDVQQEAPWTAS